MDLRAEQWRIYKEIDSWIYIELIRHKSEFFSIFYAE